ncbi:MAG: nicotinamide-nucleotide amidohydrolase family protein [Clostridiales bacterium]|nr:nicotinamide-nucleotide amidohydrolase family protein [Clostridiales bacterium]
MTEAAKRIIALLRAQNKTLATAESCTGGLLAGALTAVPGSSACFGYGFITYSNDAKQRLLRVSIKTLALYGAVSAETASAMARGAREMAGADLALAITGIAGPGGATAEKPLGLVYLGLAAGEWAITEKHIFSGGREKVRASSVAAAMAMLEKHLTIDS